MSRTGQAEKSAADYGREAVSQWADAARYGARALAARREATSKLGRPGRLASIVKLGGDLVDRVVSNGGQRETGEGDDAAGATDVHGVAEGDGVGAGAPLPIQAAIDVALPVAAVFELCTRFEDYPAMVDRVAAVEVEDDTHFSVLVRAGKRSHQVSIELVDELPDERLDWEAVGELEHSGVLTFHPLAPRLTRLELTIERESEGLVEHLGRILALPERGLNQELRRFKAVAELWDDGKGYEPTEIGAPVEEAPDDEDFEEPEEETSEGQEPEPEENEAAPER